MRSEDRWKFDNKLREFKEFLSLQDGLKVGTDFAYTAKDGEIHVICHISCYPAVKRSLQRYGLSIEGIQTYS